MTTTNQEAFYSSDAYRIQEIAAIQQTFPNASPKQVEAHFVKMEAWKAKVRQETADMARADRHAEEFAAWKTL